jgi:hypothetical protein
MQRSGRDQEKIAPGAVNLIVVVRGHISEFVKRDGIIVVIVFQNIVTEIDIVIIVVIKNQIIVFFDVLHLGGLRILGIRNHCTGLGCVNGDFIAGIRANDWRRVQVVKAFAGFGAKALCAPLFLRHRLSLQKSLSSLAGDRCQLP